MSFGSFLYRTRIVLGLQLGIAGVLAFQMGQYLIPITGFQSSYLGSMWCAVSALVVMRPANEETKASAWARLLASLVGVFVASLLFWLFDSTYWTLLVAIILTTASCGPEKMRNAYPIACMSALVLFATTSHYPEMDPWVVGATRFLEAAFGICVALIISLPLEPLRNRIRLEHQKTLDQKP